MSVIMTMWMQVEVGKVEEVAANNGEEMLAISERAKEHGAIAHRFYGNEDGTQVLVVDEWPDRESFETFFGSVQGQVGPLMEQAGVQGEPPVAFWRVLDTPDKFGWDE